MPVGALLRSPGLRFDFTAFKDAVSGLRQDDAAEPTSGSGVD
jgi:hypothetical protein